MKNPGHWRASLLNYPYMVQKYAFDYLDAPIRKINTLDTPMAYAPTLVEAFLPQASDVVKAVRSTLYIS